MYSQTFLVTSVRGSVDLPQIAASSVLSFFGAKMPLPAFFMAAAIFLPLALLAALPAAFFVALSVAFVVFVIVVATVVFVVTAVFVVVVIAIEEVQTRLSLIEVPPRLSISYISARIPNVFCANPGFGCAA